MASARTIITCEQLVSHQLITSLPKDIAIPFLAVDAVIEVPYGAYPAACRRHYYYNRNHIAELHKYAASLGREKDTDALRRYYDTYILGVEDFSGFLEHVGVARLLEAKKREAENCERLA